MAESTFQNVCAVLLRGGRSRRMGRDKAALPWEGGTFLQAVAWQMEMFSEKYLSVSSESTYGCGERSSDDLSGSWTILPDLIPDCGPIGGIYTALCVCRADLALVASCDIPAVKSSLFSLLLSQAGEDADLVYPVTSEGRKHLTCAVYRKSLAPVLEGQIRAGDYRLRILTELCRAKGVLIEDPFYQHMLTNVNTAAELEKLNCRIGTEGSEL